MCFPGPGPSADQAEAWVYQTSLRGALRRRRVAPADEAGGLAEHFFVSAKCSQGHVEGREGNRQRGQQRELGRLVGDVHRKGKLLSRARVCVEHVKVLWGMRRSEERRVGKE